MKRIYATLALLGGLFTASTAQTINLESYIALPLEAAEIEKGTPLDTSKILFGTYFNGPDDIFANDIIWFMTSFSTPATDSTTYIDGAQYSSDILASDSGFIFTFPNNNEIGAGHSAPFTTHADSINGLYDWADWEAGTITLIRPPFECGKAYGIWYRSLYIGDEEANPIAEDPSPENNRAVQRIIWSCDGPSSVNDMIADKEKIQITAYPNPAVNEVNFSYNFEKSTHATVLVRDLTGRVVYAKNYGRVNAGSQVFNIALDGIAAGNYIVELDSDYQRGTTKFTVTK